jgi:hypothetical protein
VSIANPGPEIKTQQGGAILTVVAVLGFMLVVVQGSVYYRAKGGNRFQGTEKDKILASQLAEAGIEENIADIGKRKLRVHSGLIDTTTYDHKGFEGGTYTSRLTTVAMGAQADTVDLVSTGSMGNGTQSVKARLRLKKYLDTTRTPIVVVVPFDSTYTLTHVVQDTAASTTIKDPMSMPAVNTTPAYAACMASGSNKCDVCHLPSGDVSKANVINISKNAIGTHISHHGDYVSTDNSCDLYKPKTVYTYSSHTVTETKHVMVDHTTYSTTVVVDTAVKVQVLSWK